MEKILLSILYVKSYWYLKMKWGIFGDLQKLRKFFSKLSLPDFLLKININIFLNYSFEKYGCSKKLGTFGDFEKIAEFQKIAFLEKIC